MTPRPQNLKTLTNSVVLFSFGQSYQRQSVRDPSPNTTELILNSSPDNSHLPVSIARLRFASEEGFDHRIS